MQNWPQSRHVQGSSCTGGKFRDAGPSGRLEDERRQPVDQIQGVGGAADLVAGQRQVGFLAGLADDPLGKRRPVRAEDP